MFTSNRFVAGMETLLCSKGLSFLHGQEVLTRRLLQRCMDCDAQCVEDVFTLFDGQVLVGQRLNSIGNVIFSCDSLIVMDT